MSQLPLSALGSLACVCSAIEVPDDAFRTFLLQRAALVKRGLAGHRDLGDEDTALLAAAACDAETGCAAACRRLWSRGCQLCAYRGVSGVFFPLTARGICATCALERAGQADLWRRSALAREQLERRRCDRDTRAWILSALGDAMMGALLRSRGRPAATRPRRSSADDGRGSAGGVAADGADGIAGSGGGGGGGDDGCRGTPAAAAMATAAAAAAAAAVGWPSPSVELLFDSSRDGGSCAALLRAAQAAEASLLLVRESEAATGAVAAPSAARRFGAFVSTPNPNPNPNPNANRFGAFVSTPWLRSSTTAFFGDERCFLFSSGAAADDDASRDAPTLHRATGRDARFVHASPAEHGLGFGGELGGFALGLESDLSRGRCLPSHTYGAGTARLASAPDFVCEAVQLWSVAGAGGGHGGSAGGGRREPWKDEAKGCLEPGMNKLMLEFVGMEKEVAMLRRFS